MPEPAVMETVSPKENKGAEMERQLGALESSFKVDAILSIYAGQHSASPAIKRFARSIAKESADARARLKAISAENNIQLPVQISEDHEKGLNTLKGKRKVEFDIAYTSYIKDFLENRRAILEKIMETSEPESLVALAASQNKNVNRQLKAVKTLR